MLPQPKGLPKRGRGPSGRLMQANSEGGSWAIAKETWERDRRFKVLTY